MVAAQGGHIGTVKLLVDAGATVDIADDEGMTPLLNAIKGNFGEIALFLVEHGANPNDVFIDEKVFTLFFLHDISQFFQGTASQPFNGLNYCRKY